MSWHNTHRYLQIAEIFLTQRSDVIYRQTCHKLISKLMSIEDNNHKTGNKKINLP